MRDRVNSTPRGPSTLAAGSRARYIEEATRNEEDAVQIFELLPWAFAVLLLASMLRLALTAFRAGEFAGRQEIFPPPVDAPAADDPAEG